MESLQFVMLKGGQGRIWEKLTFDGRNKALDKKSLQFSRLTKSNFCLLYPFNLSICVTQVPKVFEHRMFSTWKNKWDYYKK